MKGKMKKSSAFVLVLIVNFVLFVAVTLPPRLWLVSSALTDMRPAAAITPILGMIFGLPAAVGCTLGNFLCDCTAGFGFWYAFFNSLLQGFGALRTYYFWRQLNPERDGRQFKLDSVARVLKFCLVLACNAVSMVFFTAILNQHFKIADFLSIDNLYQLINCFDSGLLFGLPILIFGSLLNTYIGNLKSGKKSKIVHFTMNERIILFSIITGVCICILVGTAVYLTDKFSAYDGQISLWGRIYLFEMFALNAYLFLSLGFLRFTEKKISQPIEELAHIAGNYYADHSTDEQRETMISECERYCKDNTEAGELARSYVSMAKDIGEYVNNLQSVMAEKERINAELNLASSIQAHMLPCIFPPFPDHKEFDLYATMRPAKEVGGDFYDFYMTDVDHLAVVIADVSGKGVPAALFMVIAKTLIKNYAQMGLDPAAIFTRVNHLLCDGNDAGLFVTAWLGLLELSTGKMTYVNAGHNPPLLKRKDGKFEYLRTRTGFVLAGLDTARYRQSEIDFHPGDRLFLYTDGVTEATNNDTQLYGEDRLADFLNAHAALKPSEMLTSLQADLDAFAGSAPQFDDITMLFMDYQGKETAAVERVFQAKEENIADMLEFVEGELQKADCPKKTQTAIAVAMEEIFVNISRYAYGLGIGTAKISIEIDPETRNATFVVTDMGVAFNPLEKPDPDITLPAEEREVGGLGIFIIKKTMDSVTYARDHGENRLTMIKNLEGRINA